MPQAPISLTACPSVRSSARVALGNAGLDVELAGPVGARIERVHERLGREARRLDGLLGIHAEDEQVEDDLQIGLGLVVAAGAADGRGRHAVLADQIAHQRGARPLAGQQAVGMTVLEHEHLAARAERAAQLRRERRLPEHAAARRQADHVAVAIDGGDVGGAVGAAGRRARPRPARGARLPRPSRRGRRDRREPAPRASRGRAG